MAAPIVLEGDDLIRVVGTSHYQEALVVLAGRRPDEDVRIETLAALVPEPDNPHDPHAIAVYVDGHLVGYLSREENKRWRDVFSHPSGVRCEALLASRAGTGTIGVFLRLPTPTEARAQIAVAAGRADRGREAR